MKKTLNTTAVVLSVLLASTAFAGGGKKMGPGCPEACQQQIDDLQSSQAQQNEQLSAHGKQLKNHEGRIANLEKAFDDYWYARLGVRAAWMDQKVSGLDADQIDWDSDAGFGGSIAFGREFSMYMAPGKFRAEIELTKLTADLEDFSSSFFANVGDNITVSGVDRTEGDLDISTVMLNGYYELPVYEAFSVYVMAGIGFAKYDIDETTTTTTTTTVSGDGVDTFTSTSTEHLGASDNVFAYKAGIGMTYNFTNTIAADLGYEYLGVADTDLADSINGHNVVASVRFKF